MDNTIKLYITANTTEERKHHSTELATHFAKTLGGFTITKGVGGWIANNTGELVIEPVTIIEGWITNGDYPEELITLLTEYKNECNQEAIGLVIGNTPHLAYTISELEDIFNVIPQTR